MEPVDLQIGQLYTVGYVIGANYISIDSDWPYHEVYDINPGDVFMLTGFQEVEETSSIDVEILFLNKKMWFTFHQNQSNIDYVRRAESYDIPFMTLNEDEPGSNSTSLIDTYSPTPPKIKGCFSHFLSSLSVLQPCGCLQETL